MLSDILAKRQMRKGDKNHATMPIPNTQEARVLSSSAMTFEMPKSAKTPPQQRSGGKTPALGLGFTFIRWLSIHVAPNTRSTGKFVAQREVHCPCDCDC